MCVARRWPHRCQVVAELAPALRGRQRVKFGDRRIGRGSRRGLGGPFVDVGEQGRGLWWRWVGGGGAPAWGWDELAHDPGVVRRGLLEGDARPPPPGP